MSDPLLDELLRAVVTKLGEYPGAAIVTDAPARCVRVVEQGTLHEIFLGDAYEEYASASPPERAAIVDRYARLVPPSPEELTRLLPQVLPRRMGYAMRRGIRLTDTLFFDFALESDDGVRIVTPNDLARAGMSSAEAFEIARRNLLARSRDPWTRIGPGLYVSPWGDDFDGGRLSLPTLFSRIGVRGDPVVTLPNHRAVLVTGSEELEGLQALYAATRALMGEGEPVHVAALRFTDGAWRGLHAADIAMVTAVPKLAHLEYLQDVLDHERVGDMVGTAMASLGYHVEPLSSGELDGVVLTYTQLPRVDKLVIPQASIVFCNDQPLVWAKLAHVLGKNLVPLDVWPAHFQVLRFPTLVEIQAMRR